MRSMTKKSRVPVIAALAIVLAMVFALVAPAADAITLGAPAREKTGLQTTVKVNLDESILARVPQEILTIVNDLSLTVTQMSDQSGEVPVNYVKVDVAGKDGVALSADALLEDGKLLLDIPVLLDTALDLDLQSLMEELLASQTDQAAVSGLTSLKDIDFLSLMGTLNGVSGVISSHLPEATEGTAETFTIDALSAELVRSESVLDGERLTAILDDVLAFLETDAGAIELYEKVIVPFNKGELDDVSWSAQLASFRDEVAEDIAKMTVTIQSLNDENGSPLGFNLLLESEGEEAPINIQGLALSHENSGEAELLVINPNNEMFRLFINSEASDDQAFSGTFSATLHETSDKAGPAEEFLLGTYTDVRTVPFGNAVLTLGNVNATVTVDAEQDPLTLVYNMEETTEGKYTGVIGVENVANVALEMAELGEAELAIPLTLKDKESVTVKSLADLEGLLTPDLQQRLMQVLVDLGIPLGGTETP